MTAATKLDESIATALDAAMEASEWDVADHLLHALESLCGNDPMDPRLGGAYLSLRPPAGDDRPYGPGDPECGKPLKAR